MNLKKILEAKSDLGYSCVDIAARAHVPLSTVYKIMRGETENPRYETLAAIEKVLGIYHGDDEKKEPRDLTFYQEENPRFDGYGILREDVPYRVEGSSARDYKRQGEYTLTNAEELPPYYRFELIDGKIYDDLGIEGMAGAGTMHQLVFSSIFPQLSNYIDDNGGDCLLFSAPMDVQLEEDSKDVFEPDIFIVCDRTKARKTRIVGAPDFIIEILSNSTWRKDINIKYTHYKNAGVREYWTIEPELGTVSVHELEKGLPAKVYSFQEPVPVGIYDGNCMIDFTKVDALIDQLQLYDLKAERERAHQGQVVKTSDDVSESTPQI